MGIFFFSLFAALCWHVTQIVRRSILFARLPALVVVCSCCIIYPIIIFPDTRCSRCRFSFLFFIILIFNWVRLFTIRSLSVCVCVCVSLQILLRPINLMLSIFVKIYGLLLSKFDIVMQFVSHFWLNCDVLKTVDRPLHGQKCKRRIFSFRNMKAYEVR